MKAKHLKFLLNLWPPYLGTGIRIKHIASDFSEAIVEMHMHWYNRNYVRTHFGGSLYAMVDPFYMLMMINILGKNYQVWDKAASIEFIAPGTGTVKAHFTLTEAQIAEVKEKTSSGEKYLPKYNIEIRDRSNKLVAMITKILYIKKKTKAN